MEVNRLWELSLPRLQSQVQEGQLDIIDVAEFCKVTPITVVNWIKGSHPAEGVRLIRLWHITSIHGGAPEIDKMPEFNRVLSRLFAFDIIQIDDVKLYCGQASAHNANTYAALRGQEVQDKQISAAELLEQHGDQLKLAMEKVAPAAPVNSPSETIQQPLSEPEESVETPVSQTPSLPLSLTNMEPKLLLAMLLGAAAPLAEYLRSDAVSAEERSAFRDLIGAETLFNLTVTLGALSNERARGMSDK